MWSKSEFEASIASALGGHVAEEMVFGEVTTGPSNDLQRATDMARRMVTEWGMSDKVGFVYYGDDPERRSAWLDLPGGHEYSQLTAQAIDEEVKRLINEAYEDTRRILTENRDKLEAIAQALIKYETLEASEVQALIRGESLRRPTLSDLLDADPSGLAPPPPRPKPGPARPERDLGTGPLPQPG